jgi:TPP-dependent pyruvate/acetoin dehydrogenase alpha subunit
MVEDGGGNAPSHAQLLAIYRSAARIKKVDERMRNLLRTGRLSANYYSPRGQEVLAAAVAATLRPDDYYVTIYRGLHDHLAKGVPLRDLIAEYFGKATGSCKGKGGCMHVTHPETGVMVTTGIVGSGMPIANGLALASQVRGDGRVTVTNFGDGASNIGAFAESINLASVWKLPVVFVCQNNLFSEHTAMEACTGGGEIYRRAAGYGLPGVLVDGNDAEAMYSAAAEAVRRARRGDGPTLIEARTFRFEGHNYGDPGHYIPKELYAEKLAADPVPALRTLILERAIANEAALAAAETEMDAEIVDAVEFAQSSPYPDEGEMLLDVYAKELVRA